MFIFRQKRPGNGDSKVPEIYFHSWSLLRNDIVSFWFWGYRGDWRIELQAPVIRPMFSLITGPNAK